MFIYNLIPFLLDTATWIVLLWALGKCHGYWETALVTSSDTVAVMVTDTDPVFF